MIRSATDLVELPATLSVATDPAGTVTLSFAVEDGGGSVTVAMSPGQALRLAERLTEAARNTLRSRWEAA